jgi:hypothetical protein
MRYVKGPLILQAKEVSYTRTAVPSQCRDKGKENVNFGGGGRNGY